MTMTFHENLSDRTAVVTGAASGIGEATALLLAESGARVALLSRRADRLTDLAAKIAAAGGQALAVPADVTDPVAVDAAVDRVHAAYGPVDLVVNAAGVMLANPIAGGRIDEWQRMIDTNLTGVLRVLRAFLPDLITAAEQGRIADLVNISSIGSHIAFPAYQVYGATKAALTYLSSALRTELSPQDVRVTNIEPGLTSTELPDHLETPELRAQLAEMFSEIDALSAAEIADVVGYVAGRPRRVNLRQIVIQPTRQA